MSGQRLFVRVAPLVIFVCAVATAAAAQTPKQTASEFYTAYRAAFQKAKAIEDLTPMMSKEMKAQVESTPASERPKMFEFVKEMAKGMTNVKVVKETKTDEGATLTVSAMDGKEPMTGTIRIINEGGTWKMGKESWSNK